MQVFEFHFNPKVKPNLSFDSFCYEPINIYEKRMGSLYMVGLLENTIPQNNHFVERLAKVIKDYYYRKSILKPEKSLKESLKVANEFLDKLIKQGNVNWLGNLNFTVLSIKDFKLNFTKVGNIKVMVLRKNTLIDIDKKINGQDLEPYPLKVFSNTVSGKLTEGDLVLVLTKNVFEFFQKEKVLDAISSLSFFDEKILRKILEERQEKMSSIQGIFLVVSLTKEAVLATKETFTPEALKEFSLREAFSPVLKFLRREERKPAPVSRRTGDKVKTPKLPNMPEIKVPTPKFATDFLKKVSLKTRMFFASIGERVQIFIKNKKVILIATLLLILIVGSFFATRNEQKKIDTYTQELESIKGNLTTVDSYLILKDTQPEAVQKANLLLMESLDKVSSLSKETAGLPQSLNSQVSSLKAEITDRLFELNDLETIEEPAVFHQFKKDSFVPYKTVASGDSIYFFSPYGSSILKLKVNGEESSIETEKPIVSASPLEGAAAFLSAPNQVVTVKNGSAYHFSLESPYPDYVLGDFASFNQSLYFLDKKSGQIIKYPYLTDFQWGSPQLWLTEKTTKVVGADSIAIDGSVWILRENKIQEYYGGEFQRELDVNVFPTPKKFSRIITDSHMDYIYLLEPEQRRLVILDKDGGVVRQFQSEKFDNLLDCSVSEDEKTIYLLNGLTLYRIDL